MVFRSYLPLPKNTGKSQLFHHFDTEESDSNQMIDVRENEDTGSTSNVQEQKQNVMILFKEFYILKKTSTDFGAKSTYENRPFAFILGEKAGAYNILESFLSNIWEAVWKESIV